MAATFFNHRVSLPGDHLQHMYQINTFTEPTVKEKKKIFFSHSFKGHNQKKIITTLFQHLAAFQPSPHPQIGQSSSKESAPPNFLHPETQRSKSAATATVISGFHPQPDECTEANAWFCPPSVADKAPIPGKGNWNQGSLGHTIVLCTLDRKSVV